MKKLIFSMLLLAAQSVQAQQPVSYGTQNDMPLFFQQLKNALTFPWSWQNNRSMDYAQWQYAARQAVMQTLQTPPPATDWKMEVIAEEKRKGYTAQKILFNVNDWCRVPAYLLIPAQASKKPCPAVLMLHDHGAHFSIGKEKMILPFGTDSLTLADANEWSTKCYDGQYTGDYYAAHGYVVLALDALFWGERGRKEGIRYDSQQALAANFMQMGASWGAYIAWDDLRSAEFLSSLPFVDAKRVGCLGFSMGAHRSWMTAALSPHIAASASVCWMNDTEHLMTLTNNQNKGGSAYSMLIPGIRNVMDYPHVASLACPKPALFFNGTRDKLFPVAGVESAYKQMREVWEAQGAGEHLITKFWDSPHFFSRDMQRETLEFFDREMQ